MFIIVQEENFNTHTDIPVWRQILQFGRVNWKVLSIAGGSLILVVTVARLCLRFLKHNKPAIKKSKKIDASKAYPGRTVIRFPGLRNSGNSCYLNSVLQALASLDLYLGEVVNSSPFTTALQDILFKLNTPQTEGCIETTELISRMGGTLNREQQDAHEMLQALLSFLSKQYHQSINQVHPFSLPATTSANGAPIQKNLPWNGTLATTIQCLNCGTISSNGTKTNTFSILELPISETLNDSFANSFSEEVIQGYKCDQCQSQLGCIKLSSIFRWPEILILHMQRLTLGNGMLVKEQSWMHFPIIMQGWRQQRNLLKSDLLTPSYELTAVIVHHGGVGGGHYTTFRRVSISTNNSYVWLNCSDSSVSIVNLEDVLATQAYLLFYRKIK